MGEPLDGLRVVDVTTTLTGAHISQTLADFGADVVQIEPPGGSPLRRQPAWPFWARGKRSVVLDLDVAEDGAAAQDLAAGADVFVETHGDRASPSDSVSATTSCVRTTRGWCTRRSPASVATTRGRS